MTAPTPQQFIQGQGTVSADNLNTFVQTATNVVQLRSVIGLPGMQIFLEGFVTPGDGGAGPFYWNTTSTSPDDGSTVIVPQPGVPGAWIRLVISQTSIVTVSNIAGLRAFDGGAGAYVYNPSDITSTDNGGTIIIDAQNHRYYLEGVQDSVSVMQFGAKGNGVTNDTASFTAALDWMGSIGAGTVYLPVKAFLIDPITIPRGVTLRGSVTGPFEGNSSPATSVIAPTLLVNSTATAFITMGDANGLYTALSDLLIFYPQQVSPTASTPNIYPSTITSNSSVIIQRITLVNSYEGINISAGRSIVEDCKIGSYRIGINIDGAEDWVFIHNIMLQVFYDLYAGLSPPQNIDNWILANAIGINLGRCDALAVSNVGMFYKYIGVAMSDTSIPLLTPTNSYGKWVNIDIDTCAYGIIAFSTNNVGGGHKFSNMDIGANGTGFGTTGQASLFLATGGISAPTITWDSGSVRGSWAIGSTTIDVQTGQAIVSNIRNLNPYGVIGPPSFPSSGVQLPNPYPFSVRIFISGGTVSSVSFGPSGHQISTTSTTGMFFLNVGESIAVNYSVLPSWVWSAD